MKNYLLTYLSLSFLLLIPYSPSFANELAGTRWSLVGVGCRNPDLDKSSHERRSLKSAPIVSGWIYFKSTTHVETAVIGKDREGRPRREPVQTVRYTSRDGEIIGMGIDVLIEDENLIIVEEKSYECCEHMTIRHSPNPKYNNGATTWEELGTTWEEEVERKGYTEVFEDFDEFNRAHEQCLEDNRYVYVLGKISSEDDQ